MMAAVGAAVGLLAAGVKAAIAVFARARFSGVAALAASRGPLAATLYAAITSAALAALASAPVAYLAPAAAGAGVADVMAALNGVVVPAAFSLPTLLAKAASTAAAVGSGLPVGPEGPLVHMGAAVGAGLSSGASTTLAFTLPALAPFRAPAARRDFIAAGTAAGIAAAFGAPIGGLLFAFEELAVPFSPALAAQIFAAAGAAVFALDTARSAAAAAVGGRFGLFDGGAVVWEVSTSLAAHALSIPAAAAVGAVCGGLALVFTSAVLAVGRVREAALAGRGPRARVLDAAALAAVLASLAALLPALWPCAPADCVRDDAGTAPPVCPHEGGAWRVVGAHVARYACPGPPTPSPSNATTLSSYNEMATLTLATGEEAVRRLLARGTHRELGYAALASSLALQLAGASLAASACLACGLFVPMLVIGASVGRLAGLAAVDAAAARGGGSAGAPPGVYLPPSPWAWLDPGAFALLGAGAFMGGVTRLTASVAVILVEVSNDVRLLLPLLAAILAAKGVADAGGPSLYHRLLAEKGVPWLPPAPGGGSGARLDAVPAAAAAASPAAVARERMPLPALRALLRDTGHASFPVVRSGAGGDVFVGSLARRDAAAALRRAAAAAAAGAPQPSTPISYADLTRTHVTRAGRGLLAEQQLAVLSGGGAGAHPRGDRAPGASATASSTITIDLAPYVDTSAPSVRADSSLARAYALFVALGARHVAVLDGGGRVRGVLTRKDLVPAALDAAAARHAAAVGRGEGGGGGV
jgi:chloride channel 7